MSTRIRELRKKNDWTLQELADRVGTTPQTIQRLETNNMTVSLEWMQRISAALGVSATTLLEKPLKSPVRYFGELGADGAVTPAAHANGNAHNNLLDMDIIAADPIAVKVSVAHGTNRPGDILIADRLATDNLDAAAGRDCIIQFADGKVLLRQVNKARGHKGTSPPSKTADQDHLPKIEWVAPVAMVVRYPAADKA